MEATSHIVAIDFLSTEECDKICSALMSKQWQPSTIGDGDDTLPHSKPYRQCLVTKLSDIELQARIFMRLYEINKAFFGYDGLVFSIHDPVTVIKYAAGHHYGWHTDNGTPGSVASTRALSFSIQLTNPSAYAGGDLEFSGAKVSPDSQLLRETGTMVAFASDVTHRVTPISEGRRHAIVGWMHAIRA